MYEIHGPCHGLPLLMKIYMWCSMHFQFSRNVLLCYLITERTERWRKRLCDNLPPKMVARGAVKYGMGRKHHWIIYSPVLPRNITWWQIGTRCDWAWSNGGAGGRAVDCWCSMHFKMAILWQFKKIIWRNEGLVTTWRPRCDWAWSERTGELGGQSMPLAASRLPPTLKSACFWKAFPLHFDALFPLVFNLIARCIDKAPSFWTLCKIFVRSLQNLRLGVFQNAHCTFWLSERYKTSIVLLFREVFPYSK